MNSERELFEDWAKSVTGLNLDKDENGLYISITTFMSFEAWCVSIERQGYKLVPVDVLERAISHISIAACHHNNTRNEEDIMHNDMVIIEEAMIGAVDE